MSGTRSFAEGGKVVCVGGPSGAFSIMAPYPGANQLSLATEDESGTVVEEYFLCRDVGPRDGVFVYEYSHTRPIGAPE